MHKPELINAQEMHRNHPGTFDVPEPDEIAAVGQGVHVKVCDGGERFWVKVVSRDGDTMVGTVANNLIGGQDYDYGDEIEFKTENIYDIYYNE
jgi:uncharacterized protein YegJ (DUF2314 family)